VQKSGLTPFGARTPPAVGRQQQALRRKKDIFEIGPARIDSGPRQRPRATTFASPSGPRDCRQFFLHVRAPCRPLGRDPRDLEVARGASTCGVWIWPSTKPPLSASTRRLADSKPVRITGTQKRFAHLGRTDVAHREERDSRGRGCDDWLASGNRVWCYSRSGPADFRGKERFHTASPARFDVHYSESGYGARARCFSSEENARAADIGQVSRKVHVCVSVAAGQAVFIVDVRFLVS